MAAMAAHLGDELARRVATATFVTGGAVGGLTKNSVCLASGLRDGAQQMQLLAVSLSQLMLTPAAEGSAPVVLPPLDHAAQKPARFCSLQSKPKQRRARRRVAQLLAVSHATAGQQQVLSESMLSECPSDPLLHNVRDRQTRLQLLPQRHKQGAGDSDASWVFSMALQSSLL